MTAVHAVLVAAVVATPGVGVVGLLLLYLGERTLEERTIRRLVRLLLGVHLGAAVALLGAVAALGPRTVDLGRWYGDVEYGLDLTFRADVAGAGAVLVVALVGLAVLRFSESYLHRDPGHLRFFSTALLALSCLDVIALAATLDVLFMGWELLGLCSFLLIAYYHEREETVSRALRTIFSYRAGDLGLLMLMIVLHASGTPTDLTGAPLSGALAATAGLLIMPTVAGKAGLVPFSWLASCAEGPTPSTALFYAGLSVHAGPWLLLRAWPLYESSVAARAVIVALGLTSALALSAHALTRSDVKGGVVMAGGAQIGLVVAEIGLGWHALAAVHLVGNVGLRVWQVLRAPSVLQVHGRREALLGRPLPGPSTVPTWLWLWSSEGWFDRGLRSAVDVLVGAARAVDGWSRRVEQLAVGGRDQEGR